MHLQSHTLSTVHVKGFVWKDVKQRGNRSVSVELVPLSPTALVCPFRNVTGPGTPQEAG